MWFRLAAVAGLVLATVSIGPAQPNNVYSKAVPPTKAALDRLNLRTEWTLQLPAEGTRDAITQVQTLGDQLFVQSRNGALVAVDALTGRIQWVARLGNGSPGNSYPVAANSTFVYCAHLTKLYAFYRYTGQTEFVAELGTPPTTGLAADEEGVYCVLGVRPGSAGAHRVAVFDVVRPVQVREPGQDKGDGLAGASRGKTANPVDEIIKRYGTEPQRSEDAPEPQPLRPTTGAPESGYTGSKTPSLSTLPSVVPPYNLDNRAPSPAVNVLPSMRQPYRLRAESGKYVQQTASIGVIPPSVASSLALSDLRPQSVAPPLRWEYGVTSRLLYPLVLTPNRVWGATDDRTVLALGKRLNKGAVVTEVSDRLPSAVSAPPVATGTSHYVPLDSGALVALSAAVGNPISGPIVLWRADTGGLNNRAPYISKNRVYAAGEDTGVVCIDRGTGTILWRTEKGADRVIGANEEFLYVRDHQGRLLVYDAARATDPAGKRSAPLGSGQFGEFNVHIVNTASDRIYLAADNGLIVCLRDAAAKYAK
ncbi:MAG: PQQ-binding-like beta-propeller repeat protein, partial [Gemmataceae bacterium]|nr:PQQ-binding-like beta-propeller repeat protein [Gemmataceae bacterium]